VAIASPSAKPAGEETNHAYTPAAVGFWVQLGAYKLREGALSFQRQISDQEPWLAPLLAVYADKGMHKLQAGPYPSREDARNAAEKIRLALQLVPTVVEKR
jgi:rare lipoprotein A